MTYTRLAVLFGAAALLGAAAMPAVSNAACPAPTASGSSQMQLAQVGLPRNGAGQIVDQAGIPVPGTSSQGAADDRDKTSNRAQGAADDRDKTSNRAQGAAATSQVAQAPAASCN